MLTAEPECRSGRTRRHRSARSRSRARGPSPDRRNEPVAPRSSASRTASTFLPPRLGEGRPAASASADDRPELAHDLPPRRSRRARCRGSRRERPCRRRSRRERRPTRPHADEPDRRSHGARCRANPLTSATTRRPGGPATRCPGLRSSAFGFFASRRRFSTSSLQLGELAAPALENAPPLRGHSFDPARARADRPLAQDH